MTRRLGILAITVLLVGLVSWSHLEVRQARDRIEVTQRKLDDVLRVLADLRQRAERGETITTADVQRVIDTALAGKVIPGPPGPAGARGQPGATVTVPMTTSTRASSSPSTTSTTSTSTTTTRPCVRGLLGKRCP